MSPQDPVRETNTSTTKTVWRSKGLKVEPSYSSLSVRYWGGKERQGRVLDCLKQVLVPEGGCSTVSRMLESCLVL